MLRLRLGVVGLGLLLTTSSLLLGQDAKPADEKDLPPRGRGTLPANFKKLGLSDDQLKKVYKIHSTYRSKIDDLRQQVRALEKEEKGKLDEVLTDEQKTRLREIRTGETGSTPARAPKPEKTEKKAEDKK